MVLQLFERAVLRAKVVTSDLEAFAFRNASVGETGVFYVSVGNLTRNAQKVKCGTMLGTAAPVRLVNHAVPQCVKVHKEEGDEKSKSPNDFVNRN